MDDEGKQREIKSWKRWDLLGIVVWILTFGPIRWLWNEVPWRGRHYPRKPPRLDYESPMLSMAKLAENGIIEPSPKRIRDVGIIANVLGLFAYAARSGDEVTAVENAVLREFLNANGPEMISDEQMDEFLSTYRSFDETEFNAKNVCFALKNELKHNQLNLVYEKLNHLAYLHGLAQDKSRSISRIGERLGLTAAEIRLAGNAGRQAANEKSA